MFCKACLIVGVMIGAADSPSASPSSNRSESAISARQREQFLHNRQRFDELAPAEQQRLRNLYSSINGAADAKRLKAVMERYHEWLKTLPSGQRIELLKLPVEQRLQQIKTLRRREERQRFNELASRELAAPDRRAILDWMYAVAQSRDRIRTTLNAEQLRRFERLDADAKKRIFLMALRRRVTADRATIERMRITDPEIRRLLGDLTDEASEVLKAARQRGQQRNVVQKWVVAALFSRSLPRIAPASLRKFREGLDAASRDYLENLPRDQMQAELKRMYINRRLQGRNRGGSN